MNSEVGERLQKLLAGAGHGSRRTVEEWIRAGRVTVNGKVAELGVRASARDEVRVDGRLLPLVSAGQLHELLLYHKPVGEVTTRHDPEDRPTVFERLPPPKQGRWIVVGRLDVHTSGLLLFTTDGELAHRLMHPSSEVQREYLVRVRGLPDEAVLQRLLSGVDLEDGPARFDRIERESASGSHGWFRVTLHEGRNREVRRLWAAVGYEVSRLMRIRFGSIELPRGSQPGSWQNLDAATIARLTAATTT